MNVREGGTTMSGLRMLREKKLGLKRAYVAEKLGITPDHLSNIERGGTPLKLLQIEKLSKIYGIEFEELARIALNTAKRWE